MSDVWSEIAMSMLATHNILRGYALVRIMGVQLLIAGLGCYRYWWREVGAAAGGWSNGRQKVHKTRFYSHQEKYHIKPKAEIKYTVTHKHTVLYDAFRKHIMYLSLRV